MSEMRKCAWCNPDFREVTKMTVQIVEGTRKGMTVVVTRDQFEKWLVAAKDKNREYLLMLLGRVAPDRDFKNGQKQR